MLDGVWTAPIPPAVMARARQSLLDYLAVTCACAAFQRDKLERYFDFAAPEPGAFRGIGTGKDLALKEAVFLNGLNAHALDFDDGTNSSIIHLGSPIFSLLLPLSQRYDVSTENLLRAAIVGYEASYTMAVSIQPGHKAMGYHATGTCGTLGAAIAASYMLGFTPEERLQAFACASVAASGMLKVLDDGSELKPYNVAKTALLALTALQLAKAGFHGHSDLLGGRGFLKMMTGREDVVLKPVLLGGTYAIMKSYTKPYASCRYEKNSNYEMQSVISLIILFLNVVARVIFTAITTVVNRKGNRKVEGGIGLSRMEFEFLTYLEKNGKGIYSQRKLADDLTITLSNASKLVRNLGDKDYINLLADGPIDISDKGLKALEPYRVRKAIILAAGFGQRLAPVTLDTPKPLVKVNGVRILDTLLDALYAKGITNITIVRGYKKEQFDQLLEKYPTIRFIDNPEFNLANNISSAIHAIDLIDRCYICEADLYITNPEIINKYEYRRNYLGAKVTETDDWCFKKRNGNAVGYQMGGTDCYQAFGIFYWDGEDSEKLKADLRKVYTS